MIAAVSCRKPPRPLARAVRKVVNAMSPPTSCDCCGGGVTLAHKQDVYGRTVGPWPWIYHCGSCGASAGTYADTLIPRSRMDTQEGFRRRRDLESAIFKCAVARRITTDDVRARIASEIGQGGVSFSVYSLRSGELLKAEELVARLLGANVSAST